MKTSVDSFTTSLSSDVLSISVLTCLILCAWCGLALEQGPRLVLQGLKGFSEADAREVLKDHWTEIKKKGLSPSRANDAAFFLRMGLRQQGFTEAEVTSTVSSGAVLELRVTEGMPLLLGNVRLSGVEKLDLPCLRNLWSLT